MSTTILRGSDRNEVVSVLGTFAQVNLVFGTQKEQYFTGFDRDLHVLRQFDLIEFSRT